MADRKSSRRPLGYYRHQANAIYELQMREAIMRRTVEKQSDSVIARALGQTPATIRKYRAQSLERIIVLGQDIIEPTPPPRRGPKRGGGPGPHRRGSARVPTEILDPPEAAGLRRECLYLRKKMTPFDVIAEKLRITEGQARRYLAEALHALESSELSNSALERRLMVEQLDDMIRAIHPFTVGGTTDDGQPIQISLEAMDRMLKLMDKKSKLLGLDKIPAIDIVVRLQEIAIQGSYEIAEIEDIAREVLAKRNIALPSRLLGPADAS